MLVAMLKMCSGLFIGFSVGNLVKKHNLGFGLGIALTVATTLLACILIDKALL